MIAFKKPKKNFRRKTANDENDDDHVSEQKDTMQEGTTANQTSQKGKTEKSKEKSKIPRNKSTGLLSFEDELEEGEEFVLKKSKESRKLAQRLREQKKKEKEKEKLGERQEEANIQTNVTERAADKRDEKINAKKMTVEEDSDDEDDENDDLNDIHSGL